MSKELERISKRAREIVEGNLSEPKNKKTVKETIVEKVVKVVPKPTRPVVQKLDIKLVRKSTKNSNNRI